MIAGIAQMVFQIISQVLKMKLNVNSDAENFISGQLVPWVTRQNRASAT
jgi:hypothetical protein